MAELTGVPGGGEIWNIDGHIYVRYMVPETSPPVPILFHVPDTDFLESLFMDTDETWVIDREMSRQELEERGGLVVGSATDLQGESDHPFHGFARQYERLAEVNPMLEDPEVLALFAQATLEGRDVTEDELATTEWWQTRSEGERQWAKLAASDPETAEQRLNERRTAVAERLREHGYRGDIDHLAQYLGDQVTKGRWDDQQLEQQILREVDPYRDDASPFAGHYIPEDAKAVKKGNRHFIRDARGRDWRLTGPGQVARFGANAESVTSVNVVGEAKDFFGNFEADDPTGLGGEEQVRQLVKEWLGPAFSQGWSQDDINNWAGKIRRNEGDRDRLIDELRRERLAVLPEYENPELTYEDIARPWRGMVEQQWGTRIDETDPFFHRLLKNNDASENERLLRREGLERGVEQVVSGAAEAARQVWGDGNVRGGLL